MQIHDNWTFDDPVTGLRFSVIQGETMDRLRIQGLSQGSVGGRDLWFNKDGSFDGTGAFCKLTTKQNLEKLCEAIGPELAEGS